jgi:hypothetical protein
MRKLNILIFVLILLVIPSVIAVDLSDRLANHWDFEIDLNDTVGGVTTTPTNAQRVTKDWVNTDCTETGEVNVSGTVYYGEESFCRLIDSKACCIHNKEGGEHGNWGRDDGSVTKWCRDLTTNEETFDNSLKVRKDKMIRYKEGK